MGPGPNQANVVVGGEYSLTQSSELVGAQNYLTDVGSYSGSSSFYGTFDKTEDSEGGRPSENGPGATAGRRPRQPT